MVYSQKQIDLPWSHSTDEVVAKLEVNPQIGLSTGVASARLEAAGPNELQQKPRKSATVLFLEQFANAMVYLLLGAALISALIGEWTDCVLVGVIVLANASIGFYQEWRAESAMESLRAMSRPEAKVLRDGLWKALPSRQLVVGDVIEVRGGSIIPADARLILAAELEADESLLTGESLPVEKEATDLEPGTNLAERTNMIHAGTSIARGRGIAVVTATGMQTEIGRIACLMESASAGPTPLQKDLIRLSHQLAILVIATCCVVFLIGVLREPFSNWNSHLLGNVLLTAVSLAVAAIPEGLPAIITITLALGAQRLARRKAIVRQLSAVETLGSVDVICSDKTGTLTCNRMAVSDWHPADTTPEARRRLVEWAVLNSDATLDSDDRVVGSATEGALLRSALDENIAVNQLRAQSPRLQEIPFNSQRKWMGSHHHIADEGPVLLIKGAADRVLPMCTNPGFDETLWQTRMEQLAGNGERVLAVAYQRIKSGDIAPDATTFEQSTLQGLTFLGLVGLVDPARPEASRAIHHCHTAGIQAVMITGDHPATALAVARDIGLYRQNDRVMTGPEIDDLSDEELRSVIGQITIFARVTPEHKLRIVRGFQSFNRTVAMTGDGVNDAPALRQADIGVAMGIAGTDVSKEAAAMVLMDDNFETIVSAVEEGRVVYANFRKFIAYLLTTNAGEVLVLTVGIAANLPIPLLPIHILWINLITDGLPALALGFEPGEPDVMTRSPRRKQSQLLDSSMRWAILGNGLIIMLICLGTFMTILNTTQEADSATLARARTMVFLILSSSQLYFVLSLRSNSVSIWNMKFLTNHRLNLAVIVGLALQIAVVTLPVLTVWLHTTPLTIGEIVVGQALATIPMIFSELYKLLNSRRSLTVG